MKVYLNGAGRHVRSCYLADCLARGRTMWSAIWCDVKWRPCRQARFFLDSNSHLGVVPATQADTGTKMVHIGKNTRSRIVSKGISAGHSRNCYRGLVQARLCFAHVVCAGVWLTSLTLRG